jgi:hypothetical protein
LHEEALKGNLFEIYAVERSISEKETPGIILFHHELVDDPGRKAHEEGSLYVRVT